MLRFVLIGWWCLVASALCAQPDEKAGKMLERALSLKVRRMDQAAIAALDRVLIEYPRYEQAYVQMGSWLRESHRYSEAATVYKKGFFLCPESRRQFSYLQSESLVDAGHIDEAINVIRLYSGGDRRWITLQERAERVKTAMLRGSRDTVRNLGLRLNTPASERFPFLNPLDSVLYFSRAQDDGDDDLWLARPDSCGGWFSSSFIAYPLSTNSRELATTVSADNHYIFFMRCDNRSANGRDRGGCDIVMSYTRDTGWSVPQSFGGTINTTGYEGMPCISADNRTLYFVSDRPGGQGGLDLWASRFEHGLWQEPVNLGPDINTPADETAPYICADDETLYFASAGHGGLGGKDLFLTRRTDDRWAPPVNLGYPYNSTFDDESISVTRDGLHAFLSSNRDSALTNFDLYEGALNATLRPRPVGFLEGVVRDSLSTDPLNYTSIFISDMKGKERAHYTSNRGDGSFQLTLPLGQAFQVYVNRLGYRVVTDTVVLDSNSVVRPLHRDISLLPNDYEPPPTTDSVLFTLGCAAGDTSFAEADVTALKETMRYWLGQEGYSIVVNATAAGMQSRALDEAVAYRRAMQVNRFLEECGFLPELITLKGSSAKGGNGAAGQAGNRVEIIVHR